LETVYISRSDLTALWSQHNLHFVGNTLYCVSLCGEDLSHDNSNKIELVGLRKCPHYHYESDVTITNI